MTKDLTQAWKNGGLKKDKKYYTKDKLGRTYIKTYNKKGFKGLVEEVLCEVPSYEKWKNITNTLDYEYKGNLTLREENAKLKELLKECRDYIQFRGGNTRTVNQQEMLTKIDEVLK